MDYFSSGETSEKPSELGGLSCNEGGIHARSGENGAGASCDPKNTHPG